MPGVYREQRFSGTWMSEITLPVFVLHLSIQPGTPLQNMLILVPEPSVADPDPRPINLTKLANNFAQELSCFLNKIRTEFRSGITGILF